MAEAEPGSKGCLDSAAHMTSLGHYLRLFAHEINNPLAIVYGEAYQLRERAASGKIEATELLRSAETLERMSLRMTALVQDLRSALKVGAVERSEVLSIGSILDLAMKYTWRALQAAEIELDVKEFSADILLHGRRMQMARTLWNLIENAIQALSCRPSTRRLLIRTEVDGGSFVLHVTDNGPGVEAPVRDRLFEPFVTTKPLASGLGLFAARMWAEQNGGTLNWQEREGLTTFSLRLPKV